MEKTIREFMRFVDVSENRKLVLFGASLFGERTLKGFFNEPGLMQEILYICDNDEKKWGISFFGKEVRPPSILANDKNDVVVVVASEYFPQIYKQLEEMSVPHVFNAHVLPCLYLQSIGFNEFLFDIFLNRTLIPDCLERAEHKEARKQIDDNNEKLEIAKSLLCDEKSKEVFRGVIDRRRYGFSNFTDLFDYFNYQYFDADIIKYVPDEVFVDVGCCHGETSLLFALLTNGIFKKIYAFEPDINCIPKAEAALYTDIVAGRLELFSFGLSNENKRMSFLTLSQGSSMILEDGETEIETKRLDDVIKDKVTFIKMDAEGAELAILQGAESTIKKYKPKLAVCIYHKIEDLWEIPLYIKELVPEYKLFVRHYGHYYRETVLYATI